MDRAQLFPDLNFKSKKPKRMERERGNSENVSAPQSTYIYRAPQCMSPRWNLDSPTPLAASECALPPGPKGGGAHSPAAKGVGESQFQRLEKRLALCLLCALPSQLERTPQLGP
jgi:hypothetical protein